MNTLPLWQEIFRLSSGNQWQPIPEQIKRAIGLDSRLGICGGMLITERSAQAANEFVKRLNKIGA